MFWYVVLWTILALFPGKIRVDVDGWSIVPLWKCLFDGFQVTHKAPITKPTASESAE